MRIDPSRPIEPLIGDNYGIVRMRCGNIHCCTPFTDAVRLVRPKTLRSASPALRRGLLLCIWETMNDDRSLYLDVMNGNLSAGD